MHETELYTALSHSEYKAFEEVCKNFDKYETAHSSVEGGYHKSVRLPVGSFILEVTGPHVPKPKEEQEHIPGPEYVAVEEFCQSAQELNRNNPPEGFDECHCKTTQPLPSEEMFICGKCGAAINRVTGLVVIVSPSCAVCLHHEEHMCGHDTPPTRYADGNIVCTDCDRVL